MSLISELELFFFSDIVNVSAFLVGIFASAFSGLVLIGLLGVDLGCQVRVVGE